MTDLAQQIIDTAIAVRRNQLALMRALKERGDELTWQAAMELHNRDVALAEQLWRLVDKQIAQMPVESGEQGRLM
jgi:hypothetical protein